MTSSRNPTFPTEVTAHILTSPAVVTDEDELKHLCLINSTFCAVVQPHLFRNINLRNVEEAIEFISILKNSSRLKASLRILQISFDLNPREFSDTTDHEVSDDDKFSDATDEDDGEELSEAADTDAADQDDTGTPPAPAPLMSSRVSFWRLWGECLRLHHLQALHTITICYDPEDPEFLWRFKEEAQVKELCELRCLHLAYLSDCHPDPSRVIELRKPDAGPWDSPYWALALCSTAFQRVEDLIVMAPVNPMWPPTKGKIEELLHKWFSELPPMSRLQRLVLLCGYENEGQRADEYTKAWRDCPNDPADPSNPYIGLAREKPVTGYEMGHWRPDGWPPGEEMSYDLPAVVWNRNNFEWSEGLGGEQYCRLGEYRFFNPMFHTGAERVPARLCGFSQDLFQDWPGEW